MSEDRRNRIHSLFEELAELPLSEHPSALAARCSDDPTLIPEVTALLDAFLSRPAVLDSSAGELADALLDEESDSLRRPEPIGRYRLKKPLGHGGAGAVYLAERDGLGGMVAIKLLRDPWASPARWERFNAECKTLSRFNHRHIASLFDSGLHRGTPWFAMEYVHSGLPLTEYSRIHKLNLEQRLALFRQVCEAVSYAHGNLIVHLDLKPSNILVNTEGDVKLVDFGIAKHLSESDGAGQTTLPLRMISVNYAAPEQFERGSVNVETDIHGLGVVLYELIAGRVPIAMEHLSPAEQARAIQQMPDKPSVAAARNADNAGDTLAPVQTSRSKWRDLDVLCLKAMHRDRQQRYGTVAALIDDLDRFLHGEPIRAQADTVAYRVSKYIGRHRAAVVGTAAALVVIAVIVSMFTVRLVRARNDAVAAQARTQRIQELMLNLFEGDDEAAGPAQALRVVDLLDRGQAAIRAAADEPQLQADLEITLGGLYQKLGRYDRAEPLLRSGLSHRRALLPPGDPDLVRALLALASLRISQTETGEAAQLASEAQRIVAGIRPRPDTLYAYSLSVLAGVKSADGAYEEAVALLEESLQILDSLPPSMELSETLGVLANTHYYLGHRDRAEQINLRGLEVDRELYGENHPSYAIGLFNVGNMELDRGNYRKAEETFRQSLAAAESWYGPDHPQTGENLSMLGRSLQYQGRFDDAQGYYQRALRLLDAGGGMGFKAAVLWNHIGALALERGRPDEAETAYRRALAIFRAAGGEGHPFILVQLSNLAGLDVVRGDFPRAEKELRSLAAQLAEALGAKNRYTSLAELRLAKALAGMGRFQEAESIGAPAYEALKKEMAPKAAEVQSAQRDLIAIYESLRRPDKAEQLRAELVIAPPPNR